MKTQLKFYSWIMIILFLYSCRNEKQEIINEYRKIESLINNEKYDSILLVFDEQSLRFIDYMCDTTNLSYERMKAYGKTINLPLFTTVYNHEVGHLMKTGNNNKEIFLRYLGIANVSIFSWFDKLELREEKTEVTEEEKYVVVGKKVNKNTYITSKVKFKKDDKGIYRLNLLELLKLREKILYQSYNYYVKMHRLKKVQGRERTYETTNVSQPKDILLDFLENRGNTEHQLKELMYNTQKK